MTKLLIDECLHPSLVVMARRLGFVADHVAHLGLSGSRDWQLMEIIARQEYTFVTNNRSDFLALYNREALHAGLIVIVPNVRPAGQGELLHAALEYTGRRDLANMVVEVDYRHGTIECRQYHFPSGLRV